MKVICKICCKDMHSHGTTDNLQRARSAEAELHPAEVVLSTTSTEASHPAKVSHLPPAVTVLLSLLRLVHHDPEPRSAV